MHLTCSDAAKVLWGQTVKHTDSSPAERAGTHSCAVRRAYGVVIILQLWKETSENVNWKHAWGRKARRSGWVLSNSLTNLTCKCIFGLFLRPQRDTRGTLCRCCWLVARYQPRHCSHVTSINNCRWCMSWSLLCFVLMIWQENIPPQIIYNLSLSQGSPSTIQSHVDQHPWNICSDRICLFYTVFLSVLGQQLLPLLLQRILLHFGHNFKMYSLAWETLRGRQRRKRVRRRRDRVQTVIQGARRHPPHHLAMFGRHAPPG